MATDIVPALQEGIETTFRTRMATDRRVRHITNRIRDGTATFVDGREYAEAAGNALGHALKTTLREDTLPNGTLYYNIATRTVTPALRNNYELVNEIAEQIQEIQDEAIGIGLRATRVDFPEARAAGLIDKMTEDGILWNQLLYWMGEPIVNISEAFMDDFVRGNAKFRQQAGLTAKVSRILAPGCCEWCAEAAGRGTYKYGSQPDDFFRRHEFCRCTVTYQSGRTSQNVWSKRVWESEPQEIARRKAIGSTARSRMSSEEMAEVEARLQRDRDIRRYIQGTGYSRTTATRETRNKSPAEIDASIRRVQERQNRIRG